MRDTVFSPSFGNRPSQLVGRDQMLTALLDGLLTKPGSRERASLILGQRGSGKTVLLLELGDCARKRGLAVATPTIVSTDMSERILEKLWVEADRMLGMRGPRVIGGGISALGFSANLQFATQQEATGSFQRQLTELVGRFNQHDIPVLILIDEVQANRKQIRQLVIAYQELVGQGADLALSMAGLPGAISATLNDHVLTFLNRATKVRLTPIPIGEIDAFFEDSFRKLGLSISPALRRVAAESTLGSPYLLQLVGHYLCLRGEPGMELGREEVDTALALSRSDFETDVCRTTLNALSEVDVNFLVSMSEDQGSSRISDIAARLDVSRDYAQKYRKRLIGAGVIQPAGRGRLSFSVPYLAHYLRTSR